MILIVFTVIAFLGYAIGRASHVIGGHLNTPDHWIYGVLAIIVGAFFYHHHAGQSLIAFGIGHTISDLNDMLNLKFYGPDAPGPRHFWGID